LTYSCQSAFVYLYMKLTDIANIRLINQQIAGTKFTYPKDVISYMGAIQAQDYDMSKWAIGLRLPKSTVGMVNDALDNGDIIRTHVLRPTWHLVSRDDIYWILQLTAPQVRAAMKSNDKLLGITEELYTKGNKLIEKALTGNKHLTREELMTHFKQAGIITNENRASHFLMRAETEGIICSGKRSGGQQTYTLLPELIPQSADLTKDECLAKLAQIYFISRSPATLKDFIWWSGLSITAARHALELIKNNLISEIINKQEYWLHNNFTTSETHKASVYLLPAFDEYLIAYADRSAVIHPDHQPHAFTKNGIFKPVIIVNGQAKGIWKRTVKNNTIIIESNFFHEPAKLLQPKIHKAAKEYAQFLDKTLV
jgi:hypothetical protein